MEDPREPFNSESCDARSEHHALFPLVYNELRRLAGARMAEESREHTLQPTALVHEVWLRMVRDDNLNMESRAVFFCGGLPCNASDSR